jgi:CheY-like chemotaxis protein
MSTDSAPPPASRAQANPANPQVILAVDDDPAVLAIAVLQLAKLGYTVVAADDAQAALQIIASSARIDLLFTDVVMPGINGKELAILARRHRPGLPVLFTSGFPDRFSQNDGLALDRHDVLGNKPYRRRELARAVHEMLTRQ